MALSFSQPFAGVGIAYARHEEAEAERQHDDVQHEMFLCEWSRGPLERASRLLVEKCHQAHSFSRWRQWRRYRNLINTAAFTNVVPAVPAGVVPALSRDPYRVVPSIRQNS
jgi:hypothetical protein